MIIYSEMKLENFKAWSGAVETLERIIEEDKCEELEEILEEMYPEGIEDMYLNDILWFEWKTVYSWLGMLEDEDDDEE